MNVFSIVDCHIEVIQTDIKNIIDKFEKLLIF